ncbi:hypothetical protein [Neolewinella litorea]|uniref:GNAT family N-acetyltransferase n=1 Tax=Neolewinella litorea TaxID=2562452 RepID=A0A4V3XLK4_9BACT|nr:hypothetical protein [Neolewinella litorea]THH41243.1 hypothetical protein E4021_01200 [Neolewinella litorea]
MTDWLDAATDRRWDGLVLDNYRAVLPLPRMRRLGFVPVYVRPPYTQQLGPFGQLLPGDVRALLSAVPFRPQIALPLRAGVPTAEIPKRYRSRVRTNFELDLSRKWPNIAAGFPRKLQAFLRKSSDDCLDTMDPATFVALSEADLAGKPGMQPSQFAALHRLILTAQNAGWGNCHQLREDGELLAAGFFPHFGGRTINLATVTTERGKKRRGTSRLLALVMQRHAGEPGAVFDFEGSEIPGVKAFFAKFGGVDRGYRLVEAGPRGWL